MHIRVYVKFHFHLHLQSYLSNWHIIYVVNYIRGNINVQHLLFAGVQTTATAAPDQPEPSSSPTVSAAFIPGQSGRDLSLAPALKRRAGRESITRAASWCTRLLHVQRSQ